MAEAKRELTENTAEVLAYIQANDKGEGVSIDQIAEALDKKPNQVRPVVTNALKARTNKEGVDFPALALYEKRDVEGAEKPVGFAVLTEEGRNFTISK